MYLAYDKYIEMGGTLDSSTFEDFEFEAETLINWYTFNRLKKMNEEDYPEDLTRCMYRLNQLAKMKADLINSSVGGIGIGWTSTSEPTGTTIASQSNDGVSISYNTISASEAFEILNSNSKNNEIELTIRRYLNGMKDSLGRNILYRGLYPDE